VQERELKNYTTQARALVDFGIIDILGEYHKVATQAQYLAQADKVKTLIAPTIMGDRFKLVHFRNWRNPHLIIQKGILGF